jgi:ABC-type uncharacterized transport system substrate-binding protein
MMADGERYTEHHGRSGAGTVSLGCLSSPPCVDRDEFGRRVRRQRLDTDGDGVYSAMELDALTRENMASLKDYDYFLHAFADGKPLRVQQAKDPGQIYSNNRLKLYFTVPLETPLDPTKSDFYYRIYDPEFFIAMDYIKDEPVTAQGPMPSGCTLDLKPIVTDAGTEQTREMLATKGRDWQPAPDEEFGAVFAQPLHVDCKG